MKLKILGPPGTGKTTTLLQLLEKELELGVPPDRVAFLTFTRAARVEALTRTKHKEVDFPFLKTIHSICYHQLNINSDQIVRPSKLVTFGREIGERLNGTELDPWIEEFDRVADAPTRGDILLQANHRGRHKKIKLKEALYGLPLDIDFKYASWFTKAYRSWKDTNGLLDYTDLLVSFVEYGQPLEIDVIFIDEAQDLSSLQWDVVRILGAKAKKWYIAGDDDQAIFHWAGADSDVFQGLVVDETRVLSQSFRVSKSVHKLAHRIVTRIGKRLPKDYMPTDSEGSVSGSGYLNSLEFNEKTFVLFRHHYRGKVLAEQLRESITPYIGSGSPLQSSDIRSTLLSYYMLTQMKNREAPSHLVKNMLRFTNEEWLLPSAHSVVRSKETVRADEIFLEVPSARMWSIILDTLPHKEILHSYIEKHGLRKTATPNIELMSIHQAKGREAHTVVIDPEITRMVWTSMIANPDDEHRVWYVAVTRAKERVYIMLPDGTFSYAF